MSKENWQEWSDNKLGEHHLSQTTRIDNGMVTVEVKTQNNENVIKQSSPLEEFKPKTNYNYDIWAQISTTERALAFAFTVTQMRAIIKEESFEESLAIFNIAYNHYLQKDS